MKLVKPGPERELPRGVLSGAEISQASAGATNMYMRLCRVPPGARSQPHYHAGCESACYMVSGAMRIRWGDRLEQELLVEAGDMLYVPPRETHIVENASDEQDAVYVLSRDAPHEDAVVVPWAQ